MKIFLLGANGRTGREILNLALSAGDTVTALVRAEDRLADISHAQLEIHVGSACDPNVLEAVLPGHDVVISTLGPRTPTKAACTIYSESATAIVEAMQKSGVNRLLLISTALLFPSDKFSHRIIRWIAKNGVREAGLMEAHICDSNLQWTIARTGFLTSDSTADYSVTVGAFPKGGGSISRLALAHFLLTEAKESSHLRQVVGLCGKNGNNS